VFELIPQTSGAWTEKILFNFQRTADGFEPLTGVILDKSGNVYGTTVLGGTQPGSGTVFELTAANGYAKRPFCIILISLPIQPKRLPMA
jgi:uncharacterized repeat protein (TIGR03803 family)